MAELTRHGVCYDLEGSPYTAECEGFVFHFSSVPHMDKFMRETRKREEWLNDSLSRRFRFRVDASIIAVFQLYHQVETRGFYVVDMRPGISGSIVYKSLKDLDVKAVL